MNPFLKSHFSEINGSHKATFSLSDENQANPLLKQNVEIEVNSSGIGIQVYGTREGTIDVGIVAQVYLEHTNGLLKLYVYTTDESIDNEPNAIFDFPE